MKTTIITWILSGLGIITFMPLFLAQSIMIISPRSKVASDLIVDKGSGWRDETHFRSALAFAWADILLVLPALILSNIGVFLGSSWGYMIWFALGIVSVYFSIVFWVLEHSITYKAKGWLVYYTYFWGFFLYWGLGAAIYSAIQLLN